MSCFPCRPVPGYVSQVIYKDDLGAGWGWRPYNSKNTEVRAVAAAIAASIAAAIVAVSAAREAGATDLTSATVLLRLDSKGLLGQLPNLQCCSSSGSRQQMHPAKGSGTAWNS